MKVHSRKFTLATFLIVAAIAFLIAVHPQSKAVACPIIRYATMASDAQLLPVVPDAGIIATGNFLPTIGVAISEKIVSDHGEKVVSHYDSYDGTRQFYESYGITVDEEQTDLPGWYACELPADWCVQYDSGKGIVHFYTADNAQAFCLAPQGMVLA